MLLQEVMKCRSSSSATERTIAEFLLRQREQIAQLSARQIAKEIYAAPSTVTRFCQKLGFSGYDEFSKAFLSELSYISTHFKDVNPNYPLSGSERPFVSAHKIGTLYQEVIADTIELLDCNSFETAVAILRNAQNIYVCSAGVQADVAEVFKDKMLKLGKNVSIERRINAAYYRAAAGSNSAVLIVISYTGETEQVLRVVRKARENEMPVIAITSFGGNSVSKLATCALYVSTREHLIHNVGHFSLNISSLMLLDMLYAGVFNERFFDNLMKRIDLRRGFESDRSSSNPILTSTDIDDLLDRQ